VVDAGSKDWCSGEHVGTVLYYTCMLRARHSGMKNGWAREKFDSVLRDVVVLVVVWCGWGLVGRRI
jgi:hypothetical protein